MNVSNTSKLHRPNRYRSQMGEILSTILKSESEIVKIMKWLFFIIVWHEKDKGNTFIEGATKYF